MKAGRSLATILVTAAGLVLLDLVIGRLRASGSAFPLGVELRGLAWVAAGSLGSLLVLGAAGAVLRLGPVLLTRAAPAALLAGYLDAVFLRWERALAAPRVLGESTLTGLLVGAVVLLGSALLARGRGAGAGADGAARRGAPPGLGALALVLLGLLFAAAALVPVTTVAEAEEGAPRAVTSGHAVPRVLLVVVDTLRADALAHAAPDRETPTPALDELAAQSHRYSAARAPSGWTLPSMASLLTGLSPLVHGTVDRTSKLPAGAPTLAEALAEAGYRTAAIGQNAVLSPTRELDRGFDRYVFEIPSAPPTRSLGVILVAAARPDHEGVTLDAEAINRRALAWLDEHAGEDFFLWLHYYDPHLHYEPPAEFLPAGPPPPGSGAVFGFQDFKQQRGGYEVADPAQRRWVRELYDGEVRYLDRNLGALFDELRSRGLWDDTLVVFTSDHGEEFWEHGGMEHGHTLYDELLRVPLLVKLPGQAKPVVIDRPVTLESVAPTVLTLCGIDHDPALFSAPSLFAADGAPADLPLAPLPAVGNLYYENRLSVTFEGTKYIRLEHTGTEELYDLAGDPRELSSRAATDPDLLGEGRRLLERLQAEAADLRRRLGVDAPERMQLSEDELEVLRGIGYAGDS